jgi:PAS domain-containing protein
LRFQDCAIFPLDAEGRVLDWNSASERVTRYSARDILSQSFCRFYTGLDRLLRTPEKSLMSAAQDGSFEEIGWRLRRGGDKFLAHCAIRVNRDDTGGLLGFACWMVEVRVAAGEAQKLYAHHQLRRPD